MDLFLSMLKDDLLREAVRFHLMLEAKPAGMKNIVGVLSFNVGSIHLNLGPSVRMARLVQSRAPCIIRTNGRRQTADLLLCLLFTKCSERSRELQGVL